MSRATFEAQARHRPDEAVYTVTRGGPPGLQRYAQTWTGDNTTSWETLRWNIRTGLQMSLSGMFNTGHDVGGFAGPVPDPELFLRWVQACSLNPRMVMNSWKADGTVNVPWLHASVKAEVIAALRLRYTLMPYLWSLFERAHSHHEPILRPTFYNFPDDEACFADSDDFMLGDALLVAPVVHAGDAVGVVKDAVVMGHDQDGAIFAARHVFEEFHDHVAVLRVQCCGGFVADDELRLMHQRTGDGHALLLPAGKL